MMLFRTNWQEALSRNIFNLLCAVCCVLASSAAGAESLRLDLGRYAGRTEREGWHQVALKDQDGAAGKKILLYLDNPASGEAGQTAIFAASSLGAGPGTAPLSLAVTGKGGMYGTPGLAQKKYARVAEDVPGMALGGTAVAEWPASAAGDGIFLKDGSLTWTFSNLKPGAYKLEIFAGRFAEGAGRMTIAVDGVPGLSVSGSCAAGTEENERGLYFNRTVTVSPDSRSLAFTVKAEGGFGSLNGVVLTPVPGPAGGTGRSLDIRGTEKVPVLLEVSAAGKITPAVEGEEYELRINLPPYESVTWFAAEAGRWPSGCNRVLPWSAASLERALNLRNPAAGGSPDPHGMLALFRLENGHYLVMLPLCGSGSVSWLEAEGNALKVKSGTLGTEAMEDKKEPLLCFALSRNLYEAMRVAWGKAASHPRLKGQSLWRCAKDARYPEPFRYLGWCSWEQYRRNINADLLLRASRAIDTSPLPVRWLLVDAGFQNTSRQFQLRSFLPDGKKFPQGWAPLLKQRDSSRPGKIRWMGLWHCFYGDKGGIDVNNDLGTDSRFIRKGGTYFPGKSMKDTQEFYMDFMNSVRGRDGKGFDFVKVDYQTEYLKRVKGTGNPARQSVWCSRSLNRAVDSSGLLGMINCMAQGTLHIFNTGTSPVTRCSIDYSLNNLDASRSHLFQSYTNTLLLGQTVWPDHDMFHSSDPVCGDVMALSKALSGAPVYLSDKPEDFQPRRIWPLVNREGKILRPLAPAVALPESCFIHPLESASLYGAIAPLHNKCAAVAYYNLNTEPTTRSGRLLPSVYEWAPSMMQGPGAASSWSVPAEGLAAYDWRNRKGVKLPDGGIPLSLPSLRNGVMQDIFYLLAPIEKGWAVLGNPDKYLSPACIEEGIIRTDGKMTFTLKDSASVLIYREGGRPVVEGAAVRSLPGSEDFYLVEFPGELPARRVTVLKGKP
ncbi:Sip1-related alpha-galactosidase [Akkermansia muciniphila]|uniref:Sip1-related alpha-galactosidase n=1 Tax=Akkermansia muciniphila TaxID=239935 RepID=UPI000C9BABE4|nr:Sip1-related alpha-galactosidase [Akkermansia muciniphila]PNC05726.1 hypothetical protein CXU21_01355 [Akkermansia muciniphila]